MLSSTTRKQGQRGGSSFAPAPPIPADPPPLRSGQFRLTIPNTCSTITVSASLRSDCCSPSLRNAVRLASGMSVHLHRNTQPRGGPGLRHRPKRSALRTVISKENQQNVKNQQRCQEADQERDLAVSVLALGASLGLLGRERQGA